MKNESVVSRIISAIFGNKIAIRENLFYDSFKGSLDFAPDDIPNYRAVLAAVGTGGASQIITPITGGTTPNPTTVYYNTVSAIGTGTTSTSDGTQTNQPAVTITGAGAGAYFTILTVGNVASVVTQVNPGNGYEVGDTFTITALPGIVFTITNITAMVNPTSIYRNADGSEYGGVSANVDLGNGIMITGDDDGSGHFADSFTFVIKP